jgi:hypothetical protein
MAIIRSQMLRKRTGSERPTFSRTVAGQTTLGANFLVQLRFQFEKEDIPRNSAAVLSAASKPEIMGKSEICLGNHYRARPETKEP